MPDTMTLDRPIIGNPIPQEALAHHIAILGKTGSGKSNAAKVIVEEGLDAGERTCIIDPTGAWYGLRLRADGKPSPYPVVIFGGLHADKQIGPAHGQAVAEVVATSSTPAVIDTRLMTVGERTAYFTAFAETLLRRNRGPLRLVIDEAHVFAPQGKVPDPNAGKMLHAANNLVSLGRSIGLRIVLISQRPAKLHKDSLTQVETLVAMRVIAPQDRGAVEDWIGEWADKTQGKEIVASLPSLPTGDAWIWSPEAGVLKREHFPLARTYDSGKAPSGEEAGPELQPIDLEQIDALLDKAAADIKANDPKALKVEVARLTRELALAQKDAPAPAWPDQRELVQTLMGELEESNAALERLTASASLLQKRQEAALAALQGERVEIPVVTPPQRRVAPAPTPVQRRPCPVREAPDDDGDLTAGARKMIDTLARFYPRALTIEHISKIAGVSMKSSQWPSNKRSFEGSHLVERLGAQWRMSDMGVAEMGLQPAPDSPGDLLRFWTSGFTPSTAAMLRVIVDAGGQTISRAEICALANVSPTSSGLGSGLKELRDHDLIFQDGDGYYASETLLP